jgi:hypothetical protein
MVMQNKNILVLGSKPKCKIPKLSYFKIYSANGAAERSKKIKKKKLTCVVGFQNFNKNINVRSRVLKSNPDKIVIRSGKIISDNLHKKKIKFIFFSKEKQWNFQKKFFNNGAISLILAEFFYKTNFLNKILYLYKLIKNKSAQGVSSGFFSILLALHENPKSRIITSGIGMDGGKHFYTDIRSSKYNYDARAGVDRFLINKLKSQFKDKIFSQDKDFVKIASINYLDI